MLTLDLAIATVRGVPAVPVLPTPEQEGYDWYSVIPVAGRSYHHDDQVADLHPLTVLDLPDPAGTAQLLATIAALPGLTGEQAAGLAELAEQLVTASTPPKPTEPLGLGAVVENATGGAEGQWIRVTGPNAARPWMNRKTGDKSPYDDVSAVRVLGEGVTV